MRKHRLYGFSLAMLAASGVAVSQWPGISQGKSVTNGDHKANHHRSSVADYLLDQDQQLHEYLVDIGNYELGQFLTDYSNFEQWIDTAVAQEQSAQSAEAQQAAQAQADEAAAVNQWVAGVESSQQHYIPQPVQQQATTSPSYTASSYSSSGNASSGIAACIRQAENGGSYAWGTGDGGGAYQFEPQTWIYANQLDGGNPNNTSPANQDAAFNALYGAEGSGPWSGDPCVG